MNNFFADYPVSGGVTTLNGLNGAITLAAGTGIGIAPSGQTLTVSVTGLYANQTLSNLTSPTAVNQNLVFDTGAAAILQTKDNPAALTQDLNLLSGSSVGASTTSGAVNLESGPGDAGSGLVTIAAGPGGTGLAGGVFVAGGGSPGIGGQGGTIALAPGLGFSGNGKLQFLNSGEGTPGYLWTSVDAGGTGFWMAPSSNNLANNTYLTGRNAANNADIPLIKVSAGDAQVFGDDSVGYITINSSTGAIHIIPGAGAGRTSISGIDTLLLPNAGAPQTLSFADGTNNNSLHFQAPTSVSVDTTFTLPNGDGTSGQVLETNGSGILSWTTVTGVQTVPVRSITGNDTLSALTDYAIIPNDPAGSTTYTLTLPVGVNGQQFEFATNAINTSQWTLTPSGGDTLDANLAALTVGQTGTFFSIIFYSGVWYQA